MDEDWKQRELTRLLSEVNKLPPFTDRGWYDVSLCHFPHISHDDPHQIAYTPNDDYGRRDRQMRIGYGRYLKKYYDHILTEKDIRQEVESYMATLASDDCELKFAKEPDDIVRVYLEGPSSCMSHCREDFNTPVHPTYVYGAGDLAVAYLVRRGRITARTVCWPDRSSYGRIYGDDNRLSKLLKDAGYKNGGIFTGAKLLRIDRDGRRGGEARGNSLVCPYIDYQDRAEDNGDYLVIDDEGALGIQGTYGWVESLAFCCNCDGGLREDDQFYVFHDYYCRDCFTELFILCESCNEATSRDDISNTLGYCSHCFERFAFSCTGCGDDCYSRERGGDLDDEPYCVRCYANEIEKQGEQDNDEKPMEEQQKEQETAAAETDTRLACPAHTTSGSRSTYDADHHETFPIRNR